MENTFLSEKHLGGGNVMEPGGILLPRKTQAIYIADGRSSRINLGENKSRSADLSNRTMSCFILFFQASILPNSNEQVAAET